MVREADYKVVKKHKKNVKMGRNPPRGHTFEKECGSRRAVWKKKARHTKSGLQRCDFFKDEYGHIKSIRKAAIAIRRLKKKVVVKGQEMTVQSMLNKFIKSK